jgi:NitT/TauT family transport system substrate-binding protein
MKRSHKLMSVSIAAAAVMAACGGAATPAAKPAGEKTKVKLVLQWVVQSQFAGYFAAKDKGFYEAEGLDVTIIPGGPDVANSQYVASGQADIGVGWTPGKILAPRDQGAKLVNISQIFQRSGTLMISFKDKGIASVDGFKGKNVGSWLGGNEPELFAAMKKQGIEPDKDAKIIQQGFDMNQMLKGEIDVAQAMIYNEYAQVLETKNPATGALYKPEELNVISFNDVGTAMLQDAVFAKEEWLADAKNQETAVKFLRATYKGWMFCRDNLDECVQIVLKNGSALGESHMRWQLNEINALIWPSPNGIGMLDDAAYKQTVEIAKTYGVVKNDPDPAAARTDLAKKALEGLDGDTKGTAFKKATVELKEGGK